MEADAGGGANGGVSTETGSKIMSQDNSSMSLKKKNEKSTCCGMKGRDGIAKSIF